MNNALIVMPLEKKEAVLYGTYLKLHFLILSTLTIRGIN